MSSSGPLLKHARARPANSMQRKAPGYYRYRVGVIVVTDGVRNTTINRIGCYARRGRFPKARNRLNTIFLSRVYVGTRSERRSRKHPVLLQKVYKGAHFRQKLAVAQG